MTPAGRASPAATSAARILARGLALPSVSGAACVLAFAPFYAWPVALAGLALLFGVWERSGSALQAALSGFAFGLGYFLSGVSWVFVSLHYFGAMPAAKEFLRRREARLSVQVRVGVPRFRRATQSLRLSQ